MGCVLILDDNPDACELLAKLLEHLGHQALCAADGTQALQLLTAHRVDLVILDYMMPQKDGLAVLGDIRALSRDVPVILFSADADPKLQAQAQAAGANDCWVKGELDFSQLKVRLAAWV